MQGDNQRLSKATLFCPECDHESPADGDWTRVRAGRRVHYLCPDCRTEITVRSGRSTPLSPVGLWQTWTNSVQTWWKSVLHP
jgi:transposase-like protein